MKLNDEQLTQLRDEGWIFMPDYFSEEEVAILRAETKKVFQLRRDDDGLRRDFCNLGDEFLKIGILDVDLPGLFLGAGHGGRKRETTGQRQEEPDTPCGSK